MYHDHFGYRTWRWVPGRFRSRSGVAGYRQSEQGNPFLVPYGNRLSRLFYITTSRAGGGVNCARAGRDGVLVARVSHRNKD